MKDYSFGNYICALRTGLGLSQFQLGTLVGVSDKAVSKWENGDAKPRISTCHRLAAVLGVSINELLSCEQEIAIPARKELEKMNSKLWKEAYLRLSIYGEHPPAACFSRLASEEAALCGTDAIQGFALELRHRLIDAEDIRILLLAIRGNHPRHIAVVHRIKNILVLGMETAQGAINDYFYQLSNHSNHLLN